MTVANNSNTISHIFPNAWNLQKKKKAQFDTKTPNIFSISRVAKGATIKETIRIREKVGGIGKRVSNGETFEQARFISLWTGDA